MVAWIRRHWHRTTVGADRNETLVFVIFSAQGASILKISVPIIKRRSWGFQNTPNLQNSDYFEPSYSNLKKMEDLQKLRSYSILDKQFLCHFVLAVFLANTHQKVDFWGCFGIFRISSCWWAQRFSKSMQKWLRKLKLKLATLIWKVTDSQKIDFCVKSANFNLNFLCHFCINFENLCPSTRGDPEDSETPPKVNFLMSFGQENSKKQSGTKTVFSKLNKTPIFEDLPFSLNCCI